VGSWGILVDALIVISFHFMQKPNTQAPTAKISNTKHPTKKTAGKQTTNKSQIPIFNDQNSDRFVFRYLEHVWNFEFRSL